MRISLKTKRNSNRNGDQEFVFKGTQTLAKGTYLLKGWVYVGAGSTLTIEPGTVIKGDKDTQAALIIEPGGKLIAEGKQDAPIVFTSEMPKGQRKPGDWGGLIICGKAKNNQGVLNQQIEGGPVPNTEEMMTPTIPVSSAMYVWSLPVIPL